MALLPDAEEQAREAMALQIFVALVRNHGQNELNTARIAKMASQSFEYADIFLDAQQTDVSNRS